MLTTVPWPRQIKPDQAWSGWSVVVRGHGEHVTDEGQLAQLHDLPLFSWAPGAKKHYARIATEKTTGRRISIADVPSVWWG